MAAPQNAFEEAVNALKNFRWRRLFIEQSGVIGNGWFAPRVQEDGHVLANIIRFCVILHFSTIYYFITPPVAALVKDFFLPLWRSEKVDVPKSVLAEAPGGDRGCYHPGQFQPRWLIKVTFHDDGSHEAKPIDWTDDVTDSGGYTALSYSYKNAQELFQEEFETQGILPDAIPSSHPSHPEPSIFFTMKDDVLMSAWKEAENKDLSQEARKEWKDIALRQRNARIFLDRYIDAVKYDARERAKKAERQRAVMTMHPQVANQGAIPPDQYVWLDEFCLFPHEEPDLIKRTEELSCLSDIFGLASAVCVYCPKDKCNHTNCDWGNRLWTLSEILHTNNVVAMTRTQTEGDWIYTLTPLSGHIFRAGIKHAASLNKEWHLYAIMEHANNSGSPTWQHAIHALVVEAIRRNMASGYSNELLAKALNGLLPRRARRQDLLGKDGWDDLAWLLELNQGFYNAANLAAVCSLGESKVQGRGWLGRPISPSEGNERLEPVVIAFPVPNGLNILNPRIISLRQELKRDPSGLFRNKEVRLLKWMARILPILLLLLFLPARGFAIMAGPTIGFIIYALASLIGGTLYIEKAGCVVLKNELWEGGNACEEYDSPETFLGRMDSRLEKLQHWGQENQLVPEWYPNESQAATLVDVGFEVRADFHFRNYGALRPNALVPLAIHGCGVTCLVLHHHDDPFKPAYKLGIVNMPPYILSQGELMGSLIVGAVPTTVLPTRETLRPVSQAGGSTQTPLSPKYYAYDPPELPGKQSGDPHAAGPSHTSPSLMWSQDLHRPPGPVEVQLGVSHPTGGEWSGYEVSPLAWSQSGSLPHAYLPTGNQPGLQQAMYLSDSPTIPGHSGELLPQPPLATGNMLPPSNQVFAHWKGHSFGSSQGPADWESSPSHHGRATEMTFLTPSKESYQQEAGTQGHMYPKTDAKQPGTGGLP